MAIYSSTSGGYWLAFLSLKTFPRFLGQCLKKDYLTPVKDSGFHQFYQLNTCKFLSFPSKSFLISPTPRQRRNIEPWQEKYSVPCSKDTISIYQEGAGVICTNDVPSSRPQSGSTVGSQLGLAFFLMGLMVLLGLATWKRENIREFVRREILIKQHSGADGLLNPNYNDNDTQ